MWFYDAAYRPTWYGLTHAAWGTYAPLARITFKIDWTLWGLQPFPPAAENLALHIANTVLLYWLALRLWRSEPAAWWTGLGFALLFPANIWAVMWISTRAHLLATLFYLAAMHATLWYVRTERYRQLAPVAIIGFAGLSMFSKETGVTVVGALAALLWYEQRQWGRKYLSLANAALFVGLLILLTTYLSLRAQSGAFAMMSDHPWYGYALAPSVFFENLLRYGWRTYGLLGIAAGAIAASLSFRGLRPRLNAVTKYDFYLSVLLFSVALAPVVLLRGRSGIYSYLPGIGAALLLGAVVRSLYASLPRAAARSRLAPIPILFVVAVSAAFTVGQSSRWVRMAETNMAVLQQITAQHPQPAPNTFVVLTYSGADRKHRFPHGFAPWVFPRALQLMYADPTISGAIVREGECPTVSPGSAEIHFFYLAGGSAPKVVKGTGRDSP